MDTQTKRPAADLWDWSICRHCGGDLMGARHGWVTVDVGRKVARVHSVCRGPFQRRPVTQQLERAL